MVTSLLAQSVKNLPAVQETGIQFLGGEDPLEKEVATHPSILAWRIPWTEEPRRLHSTSRLNHHIITGDGNGSRRLLFCYHIYSPKHQVSFNPNLLEIHTELYIRGKKDILSKIYF